MKMIEDRKVQEGVALYELFEAAMELPREIRAECIEEATDVFRRHKARHLQQNQIWIDGEWYDADRVEIVDGLPHIIDDDFETVF